MNLSPENRLLLYCAETRMHENILSKVKDIISLSLSWEEVLKSTVWLWYRPIAIQLI